jgi:hypothetical protein
MNKLGSYFQERRKRFGRKKEELKFPELTPEEEKEIREILGIKKTASIEHIVTSTLRKFKEVEIVKEDEHPTEEEEGYQEVGTVRIKSPGGPERLGTLRIKKNNNPDEDYGTVKIYSLPSLQESGADKSESENSEETSESGENNDNDYSTFRIHKDVVAAQPTGKVNDKGDSSQKKNRPKKKTTVATPQFVYRPPEDWEVNIIALERGEWISNMSEEAFRKYKKERPKLKDAFFFIEEKIDDTLPPVSSSSSSTTSFNVPTNTSSAPTTNNTANSNTATVDTNAKDTQTQSKFKKEGVPGRKRRTPLISHQRASTELHPVTPEQELSSSLPTSLHDLPPPPPPIVNNTSTDNSNFSPRTTNNTSNLTSNSNNNSSGNHRHTQSSQVTNSHHLKQGKDSQQKEYPSSSSQTSASTNTPTLSSTSLSSIGSKSKISQTTPRSSSGLTHANIAAPATIAISVSATTFAKPSSSDSSKSRTTHSNPTSNPTSKRSTSETKSERKSQHKNVDS